MLVAGSHVLHGLSSFPGRPALRRLSDSGDNYIFEPVIKVVLENQHKYAYGRNVIMFWAAAGGISVRGLFQIPINISLFMT